MQKRISISPVTRLEGHGKIDIILDENGDVKDSYFQVVELKGFEKFCEGRPVEELPRIMPKICGVCPGSHHMAASKACDALYKVEIPPAARKLRQLFLNAHIAHSHMLHFFALAAPDFIPGADADPAKRNLLGLIHEMGLDIGKAVLKNRGFAQKIQAIICGHPIHPVSSLPGGLAKPLKEEEKSEIQTMAASMLDFSLQAIRIFEDIVLGNDAYRDMVTGDLFFHTTNYAGMVDENGKVNFYDGKIRLIDPEGGLLSEFSPDAYQDHIAEHVEPWTYLKFPYLKNIGWKGMTGGADSGVYRVNSLARLNVSDGMATPLAQKEYEKFYAYFGTKIVHNTLAFHWARLIENVFACEEVMRFADDPEITDKEVRNIPVETPTEGVGVIEAPRGTLYHHYITNKNGIVKKVNLIVATGQNNAGMGMSVKKVAQTLIKNGAADNAVLDQVEMSFRAYDPCLACATHAMPGSSPIEVRIVQNGEVVRRLKRQ